MNKGSTDIFFCGQCWYITEYRKTVQLQTVQNEYPTIKNRTTNICPLRFMFLETNITEGALHNRHAQRTLPDPKGVSSFHQANAMSVRPHVSSPKLTKLSWPIGRSLYPPTTATGLKMDLISVYIRQTQTLRHLGSPKKNTDSPKNHIAEGKEEGGGTEHNTEYTTS